MHKLSNVEHCSFSSKYATFSSPGRSPGRAIVLPPALAASALANVKVFTLKFFM